MACSRTSPSRLLAFLRGRSEYSDIQFYKTLMKMRHGIRKSEYSDPFDDPFDALPGITTRISAMYAIASRTLKPNEIEAKSTTDINLNHIRGEPVCASKEVAPNGQCRFTTEAVRFRPNRRLRRHSLSDL